MIELMTINISKSLASGLYRINVQPSFVSISLARVQCLPSTVTVNNLEEHKIFITQSKSYKNYDSSMVG